MKLRIGLLLAFACLALGVLVALGSSPAGVAAAPPTDGAGRSSAPGVPATSCLTGTWGMAPRYPIPVEFQAVVAYGGQIYSFGGDDGYQGVARSYKYDPGTSLWTRLADLPNAGGKAVTDGNNIYIVNGNAGPGNSLTRYDPRTNAYTVLAPPALPVFWHAVAYLNGKIYRIGGTDGDNATNTVEVYTISTNTWAQAAPYPLTTGGIAAVSLGGYIYTAGGSTAAGVTTKTYRYDPATDTWDDTAITDLPVPLMIAADDMLDGRWFLAGGYDSQNNNTVLAWDPASDTWATLPPLPNGRLLSDGAALSSSFYLIGGTAEIQPGGATTDNQQYRETACTTPTPTTTGTPPTATQTATPTRTATPATTPCRTGAWTVRAPNPGSNIGAAVVGLGGYVYQFGGKSYSAAPADTTAFRYDPGQDRWTPIASLPQPLLGATAVTDGTVIYLLGGQNMPSGEGSLWRYDPAGNTYTALASYYIGTIGQAAAYLNGKIYRIGGCVIRSGSCGGGNDDTDSVEVYTISSDTWTSAAPYPLRDEGIIAVAIGNYIYAVGGYNNYSHAAAFRYDPATDTWDDAAIADLPTAYAYAASGVLNGRWLLAQGVSGANADAWDPGTNTWASLPPMPNFYAPVVNGAVVDGAFYVVGARDTARYAETLCYPPSVTATPSPPPTPLPGTPSWTPIRPTATRTISPPTLPPTPLPGTPSWTPTRPTATRTAGPPTLTPLPNTTPTATPCAVSFSDVQPSDYFYAPVRYLACRGVVSGYSGGTFRPYANTTRAQQVKIVVLGSALPIHTPAAGAYTFADVPPGAPFYDVVETAFAAGIASGYGCGGPGEPCDAQYRRYFRPNAAVTRGQLAKLDVLAAGWAIQTPASATFIDVPAGSAFYGVVETAVCHGVLSGYSDHTFRPGAPATRGQIAKIVYLSLLAPPGCSTP